MALKYSRKLLLMTLSQTLRFWSHVEMRKDHECWPWIAHCSPRGYGRVRLFQHTYQSNNVALTLSKGIPPKGQEYACHSCDNPPCCNPAHLFWGSAHDNKLDAGQKKRLPHQVGPLFRGEKNQQAKLTESQVLLIRSAKGSQQKIAEQFGIARSTVQAIRARKLWGYL